MNPPKRVDPCATKVSEERLSSYFFTLVLWFLLAFLSFLVWSDEPLANRVVAPRTSDRPSIKVISFFIEDHPGEHGGLSKPITAEQRAQYAKEGVAMIEATVKAADVKGIVQAMRDHDKFTHDVILPKYGNILPK